MFVARLPVVLVMVAASGFASAGAVAAARGVTVQITQLPGEFAAGAAPAPVTVVASRSRGGCIRVRWSLVLGVEGVRPDHVRVDRIEQDGSFPTRVEATGDAIRITDRRLDPGTLCRGRTVTARYEISVAGEATGATGRLTLAAAAFSAGGQLLDRTTATRPVRLPRAPQPSDAVGADVQGADGLSAERLGADGPAAGRTSDSRVVRVGPIGLAVGAAMVLSGLVLLARVRRRSRRLRRLAEVRRPARRPAARGRLGPAAADISRRTTQRRGRPRQTLTLPPARR